MGYVITENNDKKLYDLKSFVADTVEDMYKIPGKIVPGSTCLIIQDSTVWMMNTEGEWKEL